MDFAASMDCDYQKITERLLASYSKGGINHIDGTNLPSKRAIENLCEELLRLTFPGFFDDVAVNSEMVEIETAERVAKIIGRMKVEARRSLRFRSEVPADLDATAHALVCDFLRQLPDVRALLQTDVQAAFEGDPAARNFEEIILAYPCMEAIAIQRLAHVLYGAELPLIPRMMTEWAHKRTGIDIHPGASLGASFFIDHGTGVVIGETCVIGHHVKLYHGVTLGAKSFQKDADGSIVKGGQRHPRVEDYVTIYPNATVLGGETVIGKHSTIGANSFIMASIPAYSLVALGDQQQKILDKRARESARP